MIQGYSLADSGAQARSDAIDAEILRDHARREAAKNDPKLLILGSGDSGKTTFLKQLKLRFGGFTPKQLFEFRLQMYDNILDSAKALVAACDGLGLPLENANARETLLRYGPAVSAASQGPMPADVVAAIRELWATESMKAAWLKANIFKIQDTADYFLDRLEVITQPTYALTDIDILHIRHPTTVVSESSFQVQEHRIHVYDVAGQRGFRKQWSSHFEHVHVVLFVTSLASFDQILVEDIRVNRMKDAVALFDEIVNNKLLAQTTTLLLLNKTDLLKKKLEYSHVSDYFGDYKGKNEFEPVCRFFENMFVSQSTIKEKPLHVLRTCCTDTTSSSYLVSR
eukprot:jgi/Hompol1/5705/HPOL_001106-RA